MTASTCEQLPIHAHPHHAPCKTCGDPHRVSGFIPGRAMGGTWIEGTPFTECRTCGRRQFT